ncbi:MAG: cellulase, partial [Planctomycetes bacterium]|nr:cellulase [Planctomycetota bacterium]
MPLPLRLPHPVGIAMWDFSWLERRWPGAGYEDWDVAVGELADRGYEAVRIDAYPHLISAHADADWTL